MVVMPYYKFRALPRARSHIEAYLNNPDDRRTLSQYIEEEFDVQLDQHQGNIQFSTEQHRTLFLLKWS